MEGIRDGKAIDTCFVCGLLELERAGSCARCGGRVHYRPASLVDDVSAREQVAGAVEQFRRRGDRTAFEQLATLLFDGGDEAVEAAAELGIELDELRAWWTQRPQP